MTGVVEETVTGVHIQSVRAWDNPRRCGVPAANRLTTRATNPPLSTRPCCKAIRSQINDAMVTTYEVGQSWPKLPGDSRNAWNNASETQPTKLLAVFVVDANETELTTPLGN